MGPRTFFLLIVAVLALLAGSGNFLDDPRPPLHGGNYLALVIGGTAFAGLLASWITGRHLE